MWWCALAAAAAPEIVDIGLGYTHAYVLVGETGSVLVDAGYEQHADTILSAVDTAGIEPESITLLVVTHGHHDHAGSAAELQARMGWPVAAGRGDEALFLAGDSAVTPTGLRGRVIGTTLHYAFPPVVPDVWIDDSLDLAPYGVDATVRAVGGHTRGSLLVEAGDTVLVGDLIRGHLVRRHKPTLHLFHDDLLLAHDTLRGLHGFETVLPAHGSALDGARVQRWLERRAPRHEARWQRRHG